MEATVDIQEKPILFSGPLVRAILDDQKTQTRRVVKHSEPFFDAPRVFRPCDHPEGYGFFSYDGEWVPCPYGKPGDQLWVRESFRTPEEVDHLPPSEIYTGESARLARAWCPTKYEADGYEAGAADECHLYGLEWGLDSWRGWGRLRPSIHMPRKASRIQLEVVDVRVERVREISEEDAEAEGMPSYCCDGYGGSAVPSCGCRGWTAVDHFNKLWDEINADRDYPWADNPWVWVVEFRRIKQNGG